MAVVYLVGRPPPGPSSSDQLRALEAESDRTGDLAITDNVDTYQNLTLKTLAGLAWATDKCPGAKFVLKADDDVFVQVPRLLALAKGLGRPLPGREAGHQPALVVGNVASGWKPVRNPQSKVREILTVEKS